ncbi:MAG TPA: SAF domain-containing protein [Microbacterium sp.]|uniref:SAF domain-containing protein n=1 Tax=Microbacterium sp. TaxID=51671 RepID=UPI002BF44229|nr:SAF domain-containing protein [Microbacterium sp.]HWI31321.1 SAF domain-containing protein [Microbacterium sp.]
MTTSHPVRRRAFRGDARFFIGILLIVASIAGVWFVVAAARQTVPVYAADRTIVVGETVTAAELRVVDVALGQVGESYLTPDSLGEGLIAARTIREGELVHSSAVDDAASTQSTTIVIQSAVDVPQAIEAGSTVELWTAPLVDRGTYDTPRILIADATVAAVTRDETMIGGGSAMLELVIPRADVADALAEVAAESALSVIPTGGVGAS